MPARPETDPAAEAVDPAVVALVDAAPELTDAQIVILRRVLAPAPNESAAAA